MTVMDEDRIARLDQKLDQVIRVLERLEDRVSAIETGMLDRMTDNAKA